MSRDDQLRRRADAEALLRHPSWTSDEIDHAVALHDLLESPDLPPDPVLVSLRSRLAVDLRRRSERSASAMDITRAGIFSLGWLDSPDPFTHRLAVLYYQGHTSFMNFQTGVTGYLDRAISILSELDRTIQEGGDAARALLRSGYDTALFNLACACYVRYHRQRELLLLDQTSDAEREAIEADLDRAVDACERVLRIPGSSTRPAAMATLGSCYALGYELHDRYRNPETIDSAINLLREAVLLTGTGSGLAEVSNRIGIKDRLAAGLLIRATRQDVDEAIELLTAIRAEASSLPFYNDVGGGGTLATALVRRWMHTRDRADEEKARAAYVSAFASSLDAHLPTAIDVATQRGGWAWGEGWWAEAGEAYGQAMHALHLAVRRQASREERELILRLAPDVAARAAFGLVRAHVNEAALVALETGRAVLLAEAFDRRSLDYDRIAAAAGRAKADQYRSLTAEMTRLETLLLAQGPGADRVAADLEALRSERQALADSLGSGVKAALAELERPPDFAELCQAAGATPVVHLAATGEGGLALILRDGSVEAVELPELTTGDAAMLAEALDEAVETPDRILADEICEALWGMAMSRVMPALDGAAHAIVVPGGRLATLPWHAARIPGQPAEYVLDRLALSYLPNIRSAARARAAGQDMTPPLRALAIEQPEPTATRPLPSADAEIAAVHSHGGEQFRVTWLPGTEATADAVREALSWFQVIHFAGHAVAVPEDPLASAMIMAHDQRLTVRDILASGIGAARFAVLSACETARAENPLSDEIISFPTALLQCGLTGVVGTLWAASDRAAAMVMEAFYQEWQGHGAHPAQALRRAQQQVRGGRFASPLFWAPFVYVGP
jgi:hypothetical protein